MPHGKAEGMPWITPYLTVADAEASLALYERAFGFEPGETNTGDDGAINHAEMRYQGETVVMFAPEGSWSPHRTPAHLAIEFPVSFYIYTPDVDALTARARGAGIQVLDEPEEAFWGDRMARFKDPDGYVWVFATAPA